MMPSTDQKDTPSYLPFLKSIFSMNLTKSATPWIVLSNDYSNSELDIPDKNTSVFSSKLSSLMPSHLHSIELAVDHDSSLS